MTAGASVLPSPAAEFTKPQAGRGRNRTCSACSIVGEGRRRCAAGVERHHMCERRPRAQGTARRCLAVALFRNFRVRGPSRSAQDTARRCLAVPFGMKKGLPWGAELADEIARKSRRISLLNFQKCLYLSALFGFVSSLSTRRSGIPSGFVFAFSASLVVPSEVLREALRTPLGDASRWVCFCIFECRSLCHPRSFAQRSGRRSTMSRGGWYRPKL
jgi:hypothetical protein